MSSKLKSSAAQLSGVVLLLLVSFKSAMPQSDAGQTPPTLGVVVADMDRSLQPGDDFYRYSNGAWLRTNVIPADRASVSVFSQLAELSDHRVSGLIDSVANSSDAAAPATRKIADLYHSYMDEAAIEARGLTPLKAEFAAIEAIRDKRGLARALGQSIRADEDPLNAAIFHTANFLGLWAAPGFRDSDHYAAYLLQGGIEMPDREYYLQDNEQMKTAREHYRAHVIAMLKLAQLSDPEARADRVISLEHAIAERHWNLAVSQEVRKTNNLWKLSDFAARAPGLDWAEFFRAAGLPTRSTIYAWQPSAIAGEAALVAAKPLSTWKDWLTYHALEDHADALPKAFAEEHFAFFNHFLSGTPERASRERRAIDEVNGRLGDEVGKLYAAKYFPPDSKASVQAMVTNIVAAFHKRIDALPWMTDATKAQAHKKLSSLYIGIGYPEIWRDYSRLEIKPDDLFGNELRSELFEYRYSVSRLGKQVDRREWCMTPQTVNAVNLPVQNALNFPAAILEPPFFDLKAPDAVNYAAIGSIIGHEISHTFDSEGSAFDAKGQLRNWWTPQDFQHFSKATEQLANQYDQYHPFPDLALNGKQTLAENIADLGGLAAAYDAYRVPLKGAEAPRDGDLSGDQQFFISYAQSRRSHIRDAALRRQVMTDGHSPSEYRSDMVRNLDAWYDAFPVKEGEKLYLSPQNRVRIW